MEQIAIKSGFDASVFPKEVEVENHAYTGHYFSEYSILSNGNKSLKVYFIDAKGNQELGGYDKDSAKEVIQKYFSTRFTYGINPLAPSNFLAFLWQFYTSTEVFNIKVWKIVCWLIFVLYIEYSAYLTFDGLIGFNIFIIFIISGVFMPVPSLTKIAAAILLFVALIHLPIGYYTFLRIAVTCIAAYNAYEARNDANKLWMIFFIVAAIVFNPIIPIYLGHKGEWMPIDIFFGAIFLISSFFPKSTI